MTAPSSRSVPGFPPHVAAVLNAPATKRALSRALRRVRGEGGALVLLVVGPGAVAPEGVPLETAGRVLLGLVPLSRAVEIAAARSQGAAAQLGEAHAGVGGWCLYLDAGQRCVVAPVRAGGAGQGRAGGARVQEQQPSETPSETPSEAPDVAPVRARVDAWRARNNADPRGYAGSVKCADGSTVHVETVDTPRGPVVRMTQRRGGRLVAVVAVDVLAAAGLAAGLCDVLDRAHKVGG